MEPNQTPPLETSNSKNKILFVIAGLMLFIVVVAGAFLLGNDENNDECIDCDVENNDTTIVEEFEDIYLPPMLQNLGVALAEYDVNTGRAGSIVFNNDNLASNWPGNKIFFEFGTTLPGDKLSPEIAYTQLDLDTDIIAMTDGKVVEIQDQTAESNDYAIGVLFNDAWVVLYDHITNIDVEMFDTVTAGQVLGKPSMNRDGITGFTEIQLKSVDEETGEQTNYCPLSYLNPEIGPDFENIFLSLMSDWEELVGDTTIYNEAEMFIPGCVVDSYEE